MNDHRRNELIANLTFFLFFLVGILLFLTLLDSSQSFDESMVKELVALSIGEFILCLISLMGMCFSNSILDMERKKNGKHSWRKEDMDELEERVRKLEEKKDP